jgi:hypothetical protein
MDEKAWVVFYLSKSICIILHKMLESKEIWVNGEKLLTTNGS